jgi:hypothetical protein
VLGDTHTEHALIQKYVLRSSTVHRYVASAMGRALVCWCALAWPRSSSIPYRGARGRIYRTYDKEVEEEEITFSIAKAVHTMDVPSEEVSWYC